MSCEEWKEVRLGDLLNFRRGHDLPKTNMKKGNIPVVGSNGIIGYHDSFTTKAPCLSIGRSGNVGKPWFINQDCWSHNTTLYVDDFKGNNPKFLYYLLSTLNLANYGGGSAVPTLNRNHIHPLSVYTTLNIEEQKAIAAILSCLDDKIELNNRINKTLEDMAQTIFKSWFVDFEPFQDGEFVDSELGSIPKGWRVGVIADLGDVVGGSTPSKEHDEYYTSNGIPWLTPKDLSNNKNKFIARGYIDINSLGLKNSSTKIMPEGTVLFSSRAPIGYIAIAKNEITTNQGFKSVVPKKSVGTPYVYYYLKFNLSRIENIASGSTFKEVSGSVMKKISVLVPEESCLTRFETICNAIFEQQALLESQNEKLGQVRDSLLPKLMSGEIKMSTEGA
jgi:type I restriction enzyme S subunit